MTEVKTKEWIRILIWILCILKSIANGWQKWRPKIDGRPSSGLTNAEGWFFSDDDKSEDWRMNTYYDRLLWSRSLIDDKSED